MVDDHALFRAGLESLLERQGIVVIGHSRDGIDQMNTIADKRADIILLDMRLGERDGIAVLEHLNQEGNQVPVVILTTSRADRDLINGLQKGAKGYLLKDMEPDQLVDALHRVMQGETAIAPEMAGALAQHVQMGDNQQTLVPKRFSQLTPRETEILSHLAQGQSNKLIASQLGISDGTVKLHVKAILRKLGVHSRVEAAVLAVENGLNPSPRSAPSQPSA